MLQLPMLRKAGTLLGILVLGAGVALAQNATQSSSQSTTSSAAPAQEASGPTNSQSSNQGTEPLQEVVVTATGTNIAGITPVGSESLQISRSDILQSGLTDLNSVLQQLPQISEVAPAGVLNYREGGTVAYGGDLTQGNSVNLRGLGPQATLVLVDGHRVTPTGTAGVFTDANQLPLSAISNIEILEDGNSAIYGSDAVAGVVNYQIRKDLNGVEISPRQTWTDGYDENGVSVTGGHTWDSFGPLGQGNFMVSVDYDHRDPMPNSASPYTQDNLTQFGGVNNLIRGSSVTTGAINGGVGPGQPGSTPNYDGGGPIALPGALSNVAWCDTYVAASPTPCVSSTYLYRGLPSNPTGATPTYAQTSAQPTLADDPWLQGDYLGRMWRYQVAAFYNQDINPLLSIFFEGFWTKRDTWTGQSQWSSDLTPVITVNPGSPYYITPPAPAGGPMTIDYSPAAHGIPPYYTDNPDTNWTAITGGTAKLGAGWLADLSITVGRDRTCGICEIGDNMDSGALQYAVDQGEINPLSSAPLTPQQLALIMGTNIQLSEMGIEDYVLKFNGPLFDLPGGPLKLAVGGEFQHNTENIANGANRTDEPQDGIQESAAPPPVGFEGIGCYAPLPCPPRTEPDQFAWDNINGNSRRISSAFTELYVPIVGDGNSVPLVKSLTLDAAERYDEYSDFGSTENPKLSLTWAVDQDVSFRGSWGTSFIAPSLVDTNPFVFSVKAYVPDFPNLTGIPSIPGIPVAPGVSLTNVGFLLGDNPDLQPEHAHTYSVGLDLTPHWVKHLKISTTYFNIHYTNEIFSPPLFPDVLLSSSFYNLYSSLVHPVHNPADCSATNPDYDPALLPFINAVGIYGIVTPAELCSMNVWIDERDTNIGSLTEGGFDFNVSYNFDTPIGTWMLGANATRVVTEKLAQVATEAQTSILGSLASEGLVPWRSRASVGWSKGPLNATLFMNYTGNYRNDSPLEGQPWTEIPSWVTWDLNLAFNFNALANPGMFQDAGISLSFQNLFARNPPLVLTAVGGAFDANNANIYGRIMTLQLTKKFW